MTRKYTLVPNTRTYAGTPDGRTIPTDDSYIHTGPGGMAFIGRDAVALHQAVALSVALRSYARSKMMMNRNLTPSRMLALATHYTHKPYRRGEYLRAAEDVKLWADTMSAALPRVTD
jgi:hypothetical protein